MKKHKSRSMSILLKYILSCAALLLSAFLIIASVSVFYINGIINSYREKLTEQCNNVSYNITQHIEALKSQSNIPLYRDSLNLSSEYLNDLKNSNTTNSTPLSYNRSFKAMAALIHTSNRNIHSVYSYNLNLDCLIWEALNTPSPPSIDPDLWVDTVTAADGATVFLGATHLTQGNYVFFIGRSVRDLSNASPIGYFLIAERIQNLQDLCDNMYIVDGQTYTIVSGNGEIISSNDTCLINTDFSEYMGATHFENLLESNMLDRRIDGTNFVFTSTPIEGTDWYVISSVAKENLTHNLYQTTGVFVLVIIILFAGIALVTVYLFRNSVISPINGLIQSIRKSGMLLDSGEHRLDEVSFLSTSYDQLRDIIEALQSDNYFAIMRRKQLEIELLQVQINPHFLYNTLESIRMMAEIHGDSESAEMTLSLSKILRYSVGTTDQISSIRDEIAIIHEYIYLQKIRLDNLEAVHIDIPKEYYEILIPKLSLQPIVENAIIHGLCNVRKHGMINISCTKNDSFITIAVTDNGEGIAPEKLQELINRLADSEQRSPGNIGMQNINRRLKLLYGNNYGLRIESTMNKGTTVYMDLPIERRIV